MQRDVLCSLQDISVSPRSWILLKSQSMVDLFSNEKIISNIHDAKKPNLAF